MVIVGRRREAAPRRRRKQQRGGGWLVGDRPQPHVSSLPSRTCTITGYAGRHRTSFLLAAPYSRSSHLQKTFQIHAYPFFLEDNTVWYSKSLEEFFLLLEIYISSAKKIFFHTFCLHSNQYNSILQLLFTLVQIILHFAIFDCSRANKTSYCILLVYASANNTSNHYQYIYFLDYSRASKI